MNESPIPIENTDDWDAAFPVPTAPLITTEPAPLAPVIPLEKPSPLASGKAQYRDAPPITRASKASRAKPATRESRADAPRVPAGAAVAAVGRDLPQSLEAEEYLLSCCLLDGPDVISRCIEARIGPESFYDTKHGIVYEKLLDLYNRQQPIDVSVVAEELKTERLLDQIGGYAFLVQVSSRIPTTAQASYFVEKVREQAILRELIRSRTSIVEDCYNFSGGIDEFLEEVARKESLAHEHAVASRAGGVKGFTLWRPSQFVAAAVDPNARLVGDAVLERGAWTSFLGIGGLGKTRLTLWMLACQITGREWCGLPTRGEPQLAIVLSTENGIPRWKHDIERMYQNFSDSERELLERHIRILALTTDEDGDLCLGNPDTVRRLKITLKDTSPGIVVFDPLADMLEGDENKAADVVASLRILRNVVRSACPSAAVLLVHHSRTGAANVAQAGDNFNAGNFGRGSKTIYSSVRSEIQLAPQDRDDPNRLVLSCGKANNGIKFATRGIVFDAEKFSYAVDPSFDVDAWRNDVAGKRRESTLSVADVVNAVRENAPAVGGEATTKQIADFVAPAGVSHRTVQRQLKAATQQGYLRKGSKLGLWKLGAKPLPK